MAVVGIIPKLLADQPTIEAARAAAQAWVTENNAWIREQIEKHRAFLKESEIEKYQQAYDGFLESIKDREKGRGDDVNHKVQATMAGLVIDFVVDYMLGKAMVWAFEDKKDDSKEKAALLDEYREELLGLLETEEGQRVLREMLTQGSVAGYWAAMCWVDEEGNIDYEDFPVQEVIPIYDSRGRLRLVIRFYDAEIIQAGEAQARLITKAEIYDQRYAMFLANDGSGTDFALDAGEAPAEGQPAVFEHRAARIPVSVFLNGTPATYSERKKKAGVSDLAGGIFDLVEEYAHVMSDKANTVDRLQDAFLVFLGATLGNTKNEAEGEVLAMRKARAIALKNIQSDAKFIAPPQDDTAVENHLDRVRDTLHEKAFIPKLSDLSGATATEIKVKYAGVDIKAGKKEVYFTGAVKRLIQILTDFINGKRLDAAKVPAERIYEIITGNAKPPGSVQLFTADWVQFTFNRNMPQNYLEIAQVVAQLAGIVPDSYLYELLWFIPDPQAALDEMKKQKEQAAKEAAAAIGFGGEFGDTGAGGKKDGDPDDEGGGGSD
jgi:SPP1 family phage portal protein